MKYLHLFQTHLKQGMVYRSDALLGATMSFFRVMLCYLLYAMLVPKGGTLGGFTLPELVSYSVLSAALSPFVMNDSTIFAFSDEVRTGRFSRFFYTPVSPFAAFMCQSFAAVLPGSAMTLLCCVLWGALLSGTMAPIFPGQILWFLPIFALAVAFRLLLNYVLFCQSFRLTNVTGVVFLVSNLIALFSGSLAPLEVLFPAAPLWSPLYYLVDYPVMLLMGRQAAPPLTALLVLLAWTLLLFLLGLVLNKRARRAYEGVGA